MAKNLRKMKAPKDSNWTLSDDILIEAGKSNIEKLRSIVENQERGQIKVYPNPYWTNDFTWAKKKSRTFYPMDARALLVVFDAISTDGQLKIEKMIAQDRWLNWISDLVWSRVHLERARSRTHIYSKEGDQL